jgi:hypothetical protein
MQSQGLALILSLGAIQYAQGITPVESVINLLEKLEKQTMEEGKKEAAAYDKFSCFCKEQADEKLYSITKKSEQIALLDAQIKSLTADVTGLNKDIADLNTQIDGLNTNCEEQQAKRDKAFNAYALVRDDLAQAIRGCSDALKMLKSGKAPGLVQESVSKVMNHAAKMGSVQSSPEHVQALMSLAQLMQDPGTAAGSKFHSGAIVEVLQNTLKTFKVNKNDVDAEEAEKKHTFDMAQGARKNQIKALQETLEQTEKESAEKEEQNNIAKQDLAKTTADRKADKQFMDDLTNQCEEKATAWDSRSKTRANELTAIAEAMKTLKGEVVDNYSANKQLNLAQATQPKLAKVKKHSVAFLQAYDGALKPQTVQKMMKYLKGQAQKIKSKNLSNLMVKMTEDHFVKVRGMIKDMVAKLEADASSEADQKSWCDSEMKKSTEARDEAIANIEGDVASKTSAHSKIVRLTEEVQDLTNEIAELTKALNEATQLRALESKDNAKTLADATAGLAGVKKAMKILKDFYDNAFIQTHKKYVPPNSDASGKTVGDLAPATFSGENHGNQNAAVGIIGQLDVIVSDFEGTIEATKAQEAEAVESFDAYKSETETDIEEKEGSIASKNGEKDTEKANHLDYSDNFDDHTQDKALALQELAKLKPACVDTGSDYAEQVARRHQEIESLKNAYVILDEMR